jgi:hypothetical protein
MTIRHSRLKDAHALDLYLGRIQQNLVALNEQCVQLGTVLAERQEWLRDIYKLQQYLGAESPTVGELRKAVDRALLTVATGPAAEWATPRFCYLANSSVD